MYNKKSVRIPARLLLNVIWKSDANIAKEVLQIVCVSPRRNNHITIQRDRN